MCVSVCLSARICPEPHARSLPNFYACCLMPMAVARSSSGRVTKSQAEGVIFEIFFPTDYALYSTAFGTQSAEPIEMPFGMMSGLGSKNNVLRGGDDPRRKGGILGKRARRA